MKIQICSDLHLEFANNRKWLENNPLIPKGEILIIAGDTYYLGRSFHKLKFLKRVANDFKAVYLIPGNHEYYEGYDIATALKPTYEKIMKNVFMINNHAIELNGIQLIFSTMWSNIEKYPWEVMRGMVDFRRIKFNKAPFSIDQFNEIHEVAFNFLFEAVKKEGKKVVVTHHLPSHQCNIDEFKESPLNEAFYVEKTNFILENDIDFWIYGHSHRNLSDFKIGNTQMITNQFGYVDLNEHRYFDYEKVIEV